MSKELRETAEQVRKAFDNEQHPDWQDIDRLLDAYLSEHLPDDDEPVTPDFVRSLGEPARDDGDDCVIVFLTAEKATPLVRLIWETNFCVLSISCATIGNGAVFIKTPTRGHVRRLCRELGITLKEKS